MRILDNAQSTWIIQTLVFSKMTESQVILDEVRIPHGVESAPVLAIRHCVEVVRVCSPRHRTQGEAKLGLRLLDHPDLICVSKIPVEDIINPDVWLLRLPLTSPGLLGGVEGQADSEVAGVP